jgi:fumarylacetoacetate (FAA) hydrolase
MKLATLKDGSRDGQLVVVSRDLASAHYATGMATTMRQLLDDWNFISPQLEDLYATLNGGKARHAFALDPRLCMAPLPRAGRWLCGSAEAPPAPQAEHLAADHLLGPCDIPPMAGGDAELDLELTLVAATGEIAPGTGEEAAPEGVRLLMLACNWCLREGPATDDTSGWQALHRRPASSFAPLAVTPDELGPAWREGLVQGRLRVLRNGRPLADSRTTQARHRALGHWLAQAARVRGLQNGSLVGSGPLPWAEAAPGDPADAARAPSSLAGLRAVQAHAGQAPSPWLQGGDRLQVELLSDEGHNLFGSIAPVLPGEPSAAGATASPAAAADEQPRA